MCKERGPSDPLNQTSEQGVVACGTPGLEAALVLPLPEQASGQAPPEKPRGPQHPCPRHPLLRVRQAMLLCRQGNEQCSRKSWR